MPGASLIDFRNRIAIVSQAYREQPQAAAWAIRSLLTLPHFVVLSVPELELLPEDLLDLQDRKSRYHNLKI